MATTDICPRCNAVVVVNAKQCPSCDLHLHYDNDDFETREEKKGVSFLGWPRFLRKEPDWMPPEVTLPKAGWRTWLSFMVAGFLLFTYHPFLREWRKFFEGESQEPKVQEERVVVISPGQEPRTLRVSQIPAQEFLSKSPIRPISAQWHISGRVYDLMTLKPVDDATIIFQDVTLNKAYKTVSKKDGSFSIVLPKIFSGRYDLKINEPHYIARAMSEGSPGTARMRALDPSKRMELGRGFARTIMPLNPVAPAGDEPLNLFLVPRWLDK